MKTSAKKYIERRALKVEQKGGRFVFLLSLTASEILEISGVSRVSRDDSGKLIGYQRAEVRNHVKEIAEYFKSADMLLAHPIILSFDSSVKFVGSRGPQTHDGLAFAGVLRIPQPGTEGQKPAWIVDGQQRVLAMQHCKDQSFAVPICAFVADEVGIQRDQFMRINNTRPLPRGLVTELLPSVTSLLPHKLALRKLPSALCDLLNQHEESPFRNLIKRHSSSDSSRSAAVIADTVVVKWFKTV